MPSLSHPLLTTGQLGAVLQATQILSWLLRASDGHAKYFSIQLLPRGRFPLTRLYDVMSAYPVLGDSRNQWSPFEIKPAMSSARTARKHLRHGGLCALELRGVVHRRGDVGECLVGEAGPWPVWLRWCRRRAGPGPWLGESVRAGARAPSRYCRMASRSGPGRARYSLLAAVMTQPPGS